MPNVNILGAENLNRHQNQNVEHVYVPELDTDLRVINFDADLSSTNHRCQLRKIILKCRMSCRKFLERCQKKCNGEVNSDANFMYTPCGHLFHSECLKSWLAIKNTCPECRRNLPNNQASLTSNREVSLSI